MARKTTSIIKPEAAASKDAADIKAADDVKVAATGEDATKVATDAPADAGNANEQAKASDTDAEKETNKVPDAGSNDDQAIPSEPHLIVLCHRQDGRRRCGRRWPHGETIVPEADLTAFQIAQLEADPHFTVAKLAD